MLKYFLICSSLASLVSCSSPNPINDLSGSWSLQYYQNLEDGSRFEKPSHVDGEVILTFEGNGSRGRFEAHTIVKPIYGKYRTDGTGGIEIIDIAGGLQRDPDWAEAFWKALETSLTYEKNGNTLDIHCLDGQQMMHLIKVQTDQN